MVTKEIMLKRARELRKNFTDAEDYLWQFLRNRLLNGYKFRRQHVIENFYIVDFICEKRKLIIELDGDQHTENQEYDEKRTRLLSNKGYKVLRFWNGVVYRD